MTIHLPSVVAASSSLAMTAGSSGLEARDKA